MKGKKGLKDHESVAALEVVTMEQRQNDLAKLSLKKRETAVAHIFRMAGKIETLKAMESQNRFFRLLMLKQVKDAKTYREEFELTWQQFCDQVGEDRRRVDEELQDLKPFKTEFLADFVNLFGIEPHKIKLLGEATTGGIAKIQGATIIYDGQEIAISPENKDEIQAVLEKIETAYKTRLDEAEHDVRASKRVLKDKETLINKQAKDLDRYAGKARNKDLTPEEDGFLSFCEQQRITFDGFMLTVEPGKLDELQGGPENNVTARMRASYLELLGYMRRQIVAAYDTATEQYGADMAHDGEVWKPGK